MATSVRIELNSPGIRALLTDPDMQQAMEDVAEDIAMRAHSRGIMVDGEPGEIPLPITVQGALGKTRARALVVLDHPSGLEVEAKHALLRGAMG